MTIHFRRWLLLPLLGVAFAQAARAQDYILTQTASSPPFDEFLVEQMNFKKENGFDIREIKLLPGDHVTFDADGCVNRGGLGDTCYRWVDPLTGSGKPDDWYYGMVTVRGNPFLQNAQLRFIRGREFDITRTGVLHVDYKDNDYGDNHNGITDPGPAGQCRGKGPARLRVRVRHGGPPAPPIPPKDYDLASGQLDGNGLLLNPMFQIQWAKGQDAATGFPGSAIYRFEQAYYGPGGWYDLAGMPALTNQGARPSQDGGWCPKLRSEVDGREYWHVVPAGSYLSHITYFPVSYVTRMPSAGDPASEHETNPNVLLGEMDFSVNFWPYPPKKDPYLIHGETDGWEPSRYPLGETAAIKSTPFWNDVWDGSITDPPLKDKLLSLEDRRIFMTGLFNIDAYHDHDSGKQDQGWESHPVFALAVSDVKLHDFNETVTEELWHVLVRDRGQGGYCDRETHRFSFDRDDLGSGPEFFTFDLPVEDFKNAFTVDRIEIIGQDLAIKNPAVHRVSNVKVAMVNSKTARLTLTFDRSLDPDNKEYFLVEGDVHVRYTWRQGHEDGGESARAREATCLGIDDGNPCTIDTCDPATGAVPGTPVADGTPCVDRNVCNGTEICRSGACVRDPGVPFLALGASCSDGNACNGKETCDGAGLCRPGKPVTTGRVPPCTYVSCDPETGKILQKPMTPEHCKLFEAEKD